MTHHETYTAERRSRFDRLLDHFDNWLNATEDDAVATARGRQVRRVPNSRRRVYRDPRWDTVHACEVCLGTGIRPSDAVFCPDCTGTGVVRSTPTVAAAAEQPAGRTGGRP
ncbi:hypothetical protein [Amycolatopsis sp. lyj-112]|uniref:hypothetical protein n=1 Tax=Amycolatopsis sp. lyj-112 TaxID=2789288 RepID=UPI0039793557